MKSFVTKLFLLTIVATTVASNSYGEEFDQSVAKEAWITVAKIERSHGIPKGLLHSISLVESGKGLQGKVLPWPYTAGVNRTKYYKLSSANSASAKVDALVRVGFSRFDISLNGKKYYKLNATKAKQLIGNDAGGKIAVRGRNFAKRFESKSRAVRFVERLIRSGHSNVDIGLMQVNWMYHGENFKNVAEAFDPAHNAGYAVKYLKKHRETRTWWASVGRYHSGTKKHASRYIKSVWAMYKRIHKLGDEDVNRNTA